MTMMMGLCNLLTYKDLHLSEQVIADYEMVGHANAMWLSNEAQAAKHVKGVRNESHASMCNTNDFCVLEQQQQPTFMS